MGQEEIHSHHRYHNAGAWKSIRSCCPRASGVAHAERPGAGRRGKLRFESALYALLHTLSLYFPPERLSTGKAMLLRNTFDAVEKIVQYIDANYMQKITLNDLAQVSKYNRNYISQFFKSNLGVNFHDYLTRIRLREATLALSQTNQSVSEIALSHGFPTSNHSTRSSVRASTRHRRNTAGS